MNDNKNIESDENENTSLINSCSTVSIDTLQTVNISITPNIIYDEYNNSINCMNTDYNNYIIEMNNNNDDDINKKTNVLISILCNKELLCNHYVIIETVNKKLDTHGSSIVDIMNFYEIRNLLTNLKLPIPTHFNQTKAHLDLHYIEDNVDNINDTKSSLHNDYNNLICKCNIL